MKIAGFVELDSKTALDLCVRLIAKLKEERAEQKSAVEAKIEEAVRRAMSSRWARFRAFFGFPVGEDEARADVMSAGFGWYPTQLVMADVWGKRLEQRAADVGYACQLADTVLVEASLAAHLQGVQETEGDSA